MTRFGQLAIANHHLQVAIEAIARSAGCLHVVQPHLVAADAITAQIIADPEEKIDASDFVSQATPPAAVVALEERANRADPEKVAERTTTITVEPQPEATAPATA